MDLNTIDHSNSKQEKKLEHSFLHVYTCAEEAASAYYSGKPLCFVRLTNHDFGVLHSENRFWKLHELSFDKEMAYVSLFKFKLSTEKNTNVGIEEKMIKNICIAIPTEDSFSILDMEWKELYSGMQVAYGYK